MPAKKRKSKTPALDALKYLKECLICGTKEKIVATKLDTVDMKDAPRLYHVQCRHCRHALLTLIQGDDLGSSSVGLFTDLSAADALRLRQDIDGISADDIMEIHRLLQKNMFFDKIERKSK